MNNESFVPGRRSRLVSVLMTALAWISSIAVLPWAPERVPTHWGFSGEPDRYAAPVPGLFVLPLIMLLLALLLPVLPWIDPRRQSYEQFGSTYVHIQTGLLAFLLALHMIMLGAALGLPLNMNRLIVPTAGLLFVGLGNVMGKIRPNWFVGFRSPWALSSPDVWTRTHRFGGRLMVGLGLLMIVSGLLFPAAVSVTVVAIASCLLAVLTFGYSSRVWRQLGAPRG